MLNFVTEAERCACAVKYGDNGLIMNSPLELFSVAAKSVLKLERRPAFQQRHQLLSTTIKCHCTTVLYTDVLVYGGV